VSAIEGGDQPTSTVVTSIFDSVLFSGNIVKSIHTGEDEDSAATSVPDRSSIQGEVHFCTSVLRCILQAAKAVAVHGCGGTYCECIP
jgi:hypothetical protein